MSESPEQSLVTIIQVFVDYFLFKFSEFYSELGTERYQLKYLVIK